MDTRGNDPRGPAPASLRDHAVAATVIQWLGSPVGQSFLADTLGADGLTRLMDLVSHDDQP